MNFIPFSGRAYSKVSPRMGLNGFQGRSMLPKGPMVNPATQASLRAGQGAGRGAGPGSVCGAGSAGGRARWRGPPMCGAGRRPRGPAACGSPRGAAMVVERARSRSQQQQRSLMRLLGVALPNRSPATRAPRCSGPRGQRHKPHGPQRERGAPLVRVLGGGRAVQQVGVLHQLAHVLRGWVGGSQKARLQSVFFQQGRGVAAPSARPCSGGVPEGQDADW